MNIVTNVSVIAEFYLALHPSALNHIHSACPILAVLFWLFFSGFSIPAVVSQLSHFNCPFLAVLS
jgi:hypothetical protein